MQRFGEASYFFLPLVAFFFATFFFAAFFFAAMFPPCCGVGWVNRSAE